MQKLNQFLQEMKEQSSKYYVELHKQFRNEANGTYRQRARKLYETTSKHMASLMEEWHRSETFEKVLNELLDKEMEKKKQDLIKRVEKKGGKIVDSFYLTIGSNGGLNGYIICENKNVRVETIFAGGYNIQCLHYRVLVK
jgi:hypothetical protein